MADVNEPGPVELAIGKALTEIREAQKVGPQPPPPDESWESGDHKRICDSLAEAGEWLRDALLLTRRMHL